MKIDMKQYWINHNGEQSGPMDIDAVKEMNLTSTAHVWYEGLSEWVCITQVPELQGLYTMTSDQPVVTGQPYQSAQQPAVQSVQPSSPQASGQPIQPVAGEPCPPTNLVWAIISTLLCCLPAGIVGIIYALKVQNKYQQGDIEGAKRASETGAWWCIAAIVLGILSMPLVSLLQMMAMP